MSYETMQLFDFIGRMCSHAAIVALVAVAVYAAWQMTPPRRDD